MIKIKYLSRYLQYGLKFKNMNTETVYVLNSIHRDGSISLIPINQPKNNIYVDAEYVGTTYKPILEYINEGDRNWYGYCEESFMSFLDMYGLIDNNQAVRANNLQNLI